MKSIIFRLSLLFCVFSLFTASLLAENGGQPPTPTAIRRMPVAGASAASNRPKIILGNGQGTIEKIGMDAVRPGDTIYIAKGTYSGGTIADITGTPDRPVTIIPLGDFKSHPVVFTGSLSFHHNKYVRMGYLSFSNTAIGLQMAGNDDNQGSPIAVSNDSIFNLAFFNVTLHAIKLFNNVPYVWGDTSTLAGYKIIFDSIYAYKCGTTIQSSYGSVGQPRPVDFTYNLTIRNVMIEDLMSQGDAFTGIMFNLTAYNIRLHQHIYRKYSGDKGLFSIGGGSGGCSGTIHDVYMNGPISAWIGRFDVYTEGLGPPASLTLYNLCKTNSSQMGGIYLESRSVDRVPGHIRGGNVYISNVTVGNCADQVGYYCPVVIVGETFTGYTVSIKNVVGFNLELKNKTSILDESQESWKIEAGDTVSNRYFVSATQAMLDSSGDWPEYSPLPGSPLLGKGVDAPGLVDGHGSPWARPRAIGWRDNLHADPGCGCLPRRKRLL